jgi:hypothetical protein
MRFNPIPYPLSPYPISFLLLLALTNAASELHKLVSGKGKWCVLCDTLITTGNPPPLPVRVCLRADSA